MALYIITNKTIKMANNGKGIGPRGLGAPKSMAKYSSLKQAKKERLKNCNWGSRCLAILLQTRFY